MSENIFRTPGSFRGSDGGCRPLFLQRPDHVVDQFVDACAVRFGKTLRYHLRMAEIDRRGTEAARGNDRVLLGELAGGNAFSNDFGNEIMNAIDVFFDDVPVAIDRDNDHLVHFHLIKHHIQRQLMLGLDIAAQPFRWR
ncbi:hypothetical protein ACVIDN_003430 [Rhizobium brockwellii]